MILVVQAGETLGARGWRKGRWRKHGITFALGRHLRNENWLG